jgi:hypothetical protein
VLSRSGSEWVRKYVFRRLIRVEQENAQGVARKETRISPDNYDCQVMGKETANGRPFYVTPTSLRDGLIPGIYSVDEAALEWAVSRWCLYRASASSMATFAARICWFTVAASSGSTPLERRRTTFQ